MRHSTRFFFLVLAAFLGTLLATVSAQAKTPQGNPGLRSASALVTDSAELKAAIADNADYIKKETQADSLNDQPLDGVDGSAYEIGEFGVAIYLRVL